MKFLTIFLLVNIVPAVMMSQSVHGIISGGDGKPLIGVTVKFLRADDTTIVRGARTNTKGKFTVGNIKPGDYLPRIHYVGYSSVYGGKFAVFGNEEYNAVLEIQPAQMDNIVVTASRISEKASESPAAVSVVELRQIQNVNAVAPSEYLRGTAGVDIAQSGIGQQTVTTRGFSNVFSGQLMLLTDYRNAAVPSLRANISYLMPITDADIERIEVALGPGSALYGPNASNGVVNIITKSPFASKGTTLELTGGEREFFSATARHAGTVGENLGFKISGNYTRGRDWPYADSVEQFNRVAEINRIMNDTTVFDKNKEIESLKTGNRNFNLERFGIDGRIDYLLDDEAQITAQAGYSVALRSIELTDLSAAQAKNWGYGYALLRFDYGRLMAQCFINFSNSGESFLLRSGQPVIDRSEQIVGRLQHSAELGETQEFIYGGDIFLTRPETEKTIMGENEYRDAINEFGAYLQSKTSLFDNMLDLVLAGRFDYHNRLNDVVLSPRAALVFKPFDGQTFRLTYNSGYAAPYPFDLFADIRYTDNAFRAAGFPDRYGVAVYVKGTPADGFHFLRDSEGRPLFRSSFLQDRTLTMPLSDAGSLWGAATSLVADGINKSSLLPDSLKQPLILLLQSLKPTSADVGGELGLLNTATSKFDRVQNANDIAGLKPTVTQTFEMGYGGILGNIFRASVNIYSSKINNFISTSRPFTPNVFFDANKTAAYLAPILDQALGDSSTAKLAAALLAENYAQIPLGTTAVTGADDSAAILFAPRNFGSISLWGGDIATEFRPDSKWTFAGTVSFVSDNLFKNVDNTADVPLNAPKYKSSLSVDYTDDDMGLNIGVRWRWNGGFEMLSGIFSGFVNSYNLIDLTTSYDFREIHGVRLIVSVNNLLDFHHREFAGAPNIGRFTTLRAAYSF